MQNELFSAIENYFLKNKLLEFNVTPLHNTAPEIEFSKIVDSEKFKKVFGEWVEENIFEYLESKDLLGGDYFDFKVTKIKDEYYFKCITQIGSNGGVYDYETTYSFDDFIDNAVKKLLLGEKDYSNIETDEIYLTFEYTYDYKTNVWNLEFDKHAEQCYFDLNSNKTIGFAKSILENIELKSLIHDKIKDFETEGLMPTKGYLNERKIISSSESSLQVVEIISFEGTLSEFVN